MYVAIYLVINIVANIFLVVLFCSQLCRQIKTTQRIESENVFLRIIIKYTEL